MPCEKAKTRGLRGETRRFLDFLSFLRTAAMPPLAVFLVVRWPMGPHIQRTNRLIQSMYLETWVGRVGGADSSTEAVSDPWTCDPGNIAR
jgi:hypothetical protein